MNEVYLKCSTFQVFTKIGSKGFLILSHLQMMPSKVTLESGVKTQTQRYCLCKMNRRNALAAWEETKFTKTIWKQWDCYWHSFVHWCALKIELSETLLADEIRESLRIVNILSDGQSFGDALTTGEKWLKNIQTSIRHPTNWNLANYGVVREEVVEKIEKLLEIGRESSRSLAEHSSNKVHWIEVSCIMLLWRLFRQRLELSDYNFEIIYRPGAQNRVADALSRIEPISIEQMLKSIFCLNILCFNLNIISHFNVNILLLLFGMESVSGNWQDEEED